MTTLKLKPYTSLLTTATKVISAHKAVVEGIATHAQRERATREARYHKMEQARKLAKTKVLPHA